MARPGENRFITALVCVALSTFAATASAQDYPARPVRLVVPFAAGGGTDIAARVLADGLTQALRQTFVIDNRGGAGSVVGTEIVAKAAPDGYTLLLGNISLAFNPALYAKLPYDALRDLTSISLVVDQPNIVVAHPSLPAQTLKEFVALAQAGPGKYTYASAGAGSGTHLATELLATELKLELVHVPYKGTGPALTALLSNEISVFVSTFASALPHVKAARLRSFGVTSAKRVNTLPDVPTIAESGVPGYEVLDVVWPARAGGYLQSDRGQAQQGHGCAARDARGETALRCAGDGSHPEHGGSVFGEVEIRDRQMDPRHPGNRNPGGLAAGVLVLSPVTG